MWSERGKERDMRAGCERVRRGLRKRESERDMEGEGGTLRQWPYRLPLVYTNERERERE